MLIAFTGTLNAKFNYYYCISNSWLSSKGIVTPHYVYLNGLQWWLQTTCT